MSLLIDPDPLRGCALNPLFSPWDYQQEAFDAVQASLRKHRSSLVVMATGLGKTCLSAMMAMDCNMREKNVLFLAHRDELLYGAKLDFDFVGVPTALEKAQSFARREIERARTDWISPVEIRTVIGSVQSLKGKRLDLWDRDFFDLIIIDECHHVLRRIGSKKKPGYKVQPQYGAILNHFSSAKIMGQTGSPRRADEAELGYLFEDCAYEYLLAEAIAEGDLCDIVVRRSDVDIDLTQVRADGVHMNQGDVEDAIRPYMQRMCNAIREELGDRRILVFCPGRESVKDPIRPCSAFAAGLRKLGISAAAVWAEHPDRHKIGQHFREGEYQAVCCADLYNEGVNFPFVDGIALCSPTESPVILGQRIGRGTRKLEGKPNCKILCFDWQYDEHVYKVMDPYDLIRPAGSSKALDAIITRVQRANPEMGIVEVLDEAERIREIEELEEKKRLAVAMRKKELAERPVEIDIHVAGSGLSFRSPDPMVSLGRKKDAPSRCGEEWVRILTGFGYPESDARALDPDQAAKMRDVLFARYEKKLATPTQVRQLLGYHVPRNQAEAMKTWEAAKKLQWFWGMKRGRKGA